MSNQVPLTWNGGHSEERSPLLTALGMRLVQWVQGTEVDGGSYSQPACFLAGVVCGVTAGVTFETWLGWDKAVSGEGEVCGTHRRCEQGEGCSWCSVAEVGV